MLKTNEYFDGKVKSIALRNNEGDSTVGVMAPGEYSFNTAGREVMIVVSGSMDVQLSDNQKWQTFVAGEKFDVVANSQFSVRVSTDTAYLCQYPTH